jgi:transposase
MNQLRISKYEDSYNRIAALYRNTGSIPKACNELNVSVSYYYKICKKLNRPSVASKDYNPEHKPSSVQDQPSVTVDEGHTCSPKNNTTISMEWVEHTEESI